MFICNCDRMFKAFSKAIAYVHGSINNDEDSMHLLEAAKEADYMTMLNHIGAITGIDVSCEDGSPIDGQFLSGNKWFGETVQADKSCAVLYNKDRSEVLLVIFYDKEYDFYVVDYLEMEAIPEGTILRDPLTSLTQCIVEKDKLVDKYDKLIIIKGKGDLE